MTPEQRRKLAPLRVLWVSHSFGYRGDLMYYGEIFRILREWVPQLAVAVESGKRFANPYAIALRPLLPLYRRSLRRSSLGGEIYETELALPGPTLALRLLREQFDVLIVSEFTLPALLATLVATFRRKPTVLLIESDPAARGASTHPLVRWIKRWAVRRATVIQTSNMGGQRYLAGDLMADPGKVLVAPYLTSRPPGPATSVTMDPKHVRLLFANGLTARKGLRELLAGLALLESDLLARLTLTVVGEGPDRAALEQQAQLLDMGDRLRFVGRISYAELGSYYAASDVLAIPSLADYRSLAGFEGLGYGLALLASRHDGATAETVVDGENGFVIDPAEPLNLGEKVALLVCDRTRLERMRQAALARYKSHFSLERIAENLARSILLAAEEKGSNR